MRLSCVSPSNFAKKPLFVIPRSTGRGGADGARLPRPQLRLSRCGPFSSQTLRFGFPDLQRLYVQSTPFEPFSSYYLDEKPMVRIVFPANQWNCHLFTS